MYNYYTRFKGYKKGKIKRDLFSDSFIEFSEDKSYSNLINFRHSNIVNTLLSIKDYEKGKLFVREHVKINRKSNSRNYEIIKKNICTFFSILGYKPVFSNSLFEKNKLAVIKLIPKKDRLSPSNPFFKGYQKIKRKIFPPLFTFIKNNQRTFIEGPSKSGKTTLIFDIIEVLQQEFKTVFCFKNSQQLKEQILNFLWLGERKKTDYYLKSLLSLVDSPSTFFFIDNEGINKEFFQTIFMNNIEKSKIIFTGKNKPDFLKDFISFKVKPLNFNELKQIFFWADETLIYNRYLKMNRDIEKIKNFFYQGEQSILKKEEEKALIAVFFNGKLPSSISQSTKKTLLSKNIITKNNKKEFKVCSYYYLTNKLMSKGINYIPADKLRLDKKKIKFLLKTISNKKTLLKLYMKLPPNQKSLFKNQIDLSYLNDDKIRDVYSKVKAHSSTIDRYYILSKIKIKNNMDLEEIVDSLLLSHEYEKALDYLYKIKNPSKKYLLKKIKLLRLTGNFEKAKKLIDFLKNEVNHKNQKILLNLEDGLLNYLQGKNIIAEKIFYKIISIKSNNKKIKRSQDKATRYLSYIKRKKANFSENELFEIYKEKLNENDYYSLGEISSEIGQIFFFKLKLNKALNWFDLSNYYFKKIKNRKSYFLSAFNKAEVLKELGYLDEAKLLIDKACKYDKKSGNKLSLLIDYFSLSEIEFFRENFHSAKKYFDKTKKLSVNNKKKLIPYYDIYNYILLMINNIAPVNDAISKNNSFFSIIQDKNLTNDKKNKILENLLKQNSENLLDKLKIIFALLKLFNKRGKDTNLCIFKKYNNIAKEKNLNFYGQKIHKELTAPETKTNHIENFFQVYFKNNIKISDNYKIINNENIDIETLRKMEKILSILLYSNQNSPVNKTNHIIGFETTLYKVKEWADKIKNLPFNILIIGESGSGKELLAKYIHYTSFRKSKPFLTLNCAAIPSELLESMLFGHSKGAFTGALKDKKGFIEKAEKGTLFLDEIGELSKNMQAKILRAIQEKEIIKIGETKPRKFDVRFIFATNRNLKEEVNSQNFREDLYFRINELKIELPPLRKRKQDLFLLCEYFIKKYQSILGKRGVEISQTAIDYLKLYDWKGNIRELETEIKRSLIRLNKNEFTITEKHLSPNIYDGGKFDSIKPILSLKEFKETKEKKYIRLTLKRLKGKSKKEIAEKLGISRMQLYNLINKYNL